MECEDKVDLHAISNITNIHKILPFNCENACWQCNKWSCFEKLEWNVWHWIHSWALLHASFVWNNSYANQNITQGKDVFVCDFVNFVKLVQHELYKPYCDPYAKFEDLAFDDFNFI